MKKDFVHHHSGILERVDRDVPFEAQIRWAWNPGEQIELGHSRNGHGRGWVCEGVRAWEGQRGGPEIFLTPIEEQELLADCHPDAHEPQEAYEPYLEDWHATSGCEEEIS